MSKVINTPDSTSEEPIETVYKKLDEECEAVLGKIKARKNKKTQKKPDVSANER
jgi:hypothetical protein